eukprot:3258690-Prymnesium_polylepis.1
MQQGGTSVHAGGSEGPGRKWVVRLCREAGCADCERRERLPLAQQAGNRDTFRGEGLVDGLVQPSEAPLIAREHQRPRLLAEVDGRLGAVGSGVQQKLDDTKGDVDNRRVRAVEQGAAEPEG